MVAVGVVVGLTVGLLCTSLWVLENDVERERQDFIRTRSQGGATEGAGDLAPNSPQRRRDLSTDRKCDRPGESWQADSNACSK